VKIVKKIWGREEWIVNNDLYCFKKLFLNKGYQCSYHCHKIKDETFIIKHGKVIIELDGMDFNLVPGDSIRIKPGQYHRFTGIKNSVIYEVSTTHREEDSYRKTKSGRVKW